MNKFDKSMIAKLAIVFSMAFFIACEEDAEMTVISFEPGEIGATVSDSSIIYNESVTFTDLSTKVSAREWLFPGADPETSSDSVITAVYPNGGTYTATLNITYIDNTTETLDFNITVEGPEITQEPYGGSPLALPGVIEFENYDLGGEGAAFHDTEPENLAIDNGGSESYREDDGIDIEVGDARVNVGYSSVDEWMEYTVVVQEDATYDFDFTLASGSGDGGTSIKIQIGDGDIFTDLGETGDFANTGGWANYTSLVVEGINLTAGEHVLRFLYTGGGVNIDKVEITSDEVEPAEEVEKFGIYREGAVSGSLEVVTQINNAYTINTVAEAFEGTEALEFKFDKIDTWGVMGSIQPSESPADISEYANGYYHVTLKTTSSGIMNIRLQGGGMNGYVQLDDATKTYGFNRDGTWQSLKIPMADFKTDDGSSPDFAAITELFVLRSAASSVAADEDWDWYVDNIYLTKE